MQAWTCVKVIDPELELVGQAGVVHSAAPTTVNKGKKEEHQTVDVKMDLSGEVLTFRLDQLQVLS